MKPRLRSIALFRLLTMSLLTEVYPCNESVRIVSVLGALDINEADLVHLGRSSASSRIDREKN